MIMENTEHYRFYKETVCNLINRGIINLDSTVLVVCGGEGDKAALSAAGLTHVMISNLDERMKSSGGSFLAPYQWAYEDVSKLSFNDNSFDFVFEHSGLHHLKIPQVGVCEMFRVARKGILFIEPCESLYSKLAVQMGFGQDYELAAVQGNGRRYGGVNNSAIPNYVYRFSKKDLIRTLQSYDPIQTHEIQMKKVFRPNYSRISMIPNPFMRFFLFRVLNLACFLGARFGLIANNASFYIGKKGRRFPWLKENSRGECVPDDAYFDTRFSKRVP